MDPAMDLRMKDFSKELLSLELSHLFALLLPLFLGQLNLQIHKFELSLYTTYSTCLERKRETGT